MEDIRNLERRKHNSMKAVTQFAISNVKPKDIQEWSDENQSLVKKIW